MRPALAIVIAYLLGSIPFGYLIVKAKEGGDIRATGSGGTGATNVSRRAGVSAGVMTLVLDALKGTAAVVVAGWILDVPLCVCHERYQWIFFRTVLCRFNKPTGFYGALELLPSLVTCFRCGWVFVAARAWQRVLACSWSGAQGAVLFAGLIFILIVLLTRYVSLGSIVAALTIPLFILLRNLISPVPYSPQSSLPRLWPPR